MNFLKLMFLFFGFSLSLLGVLVNWFESYLSTLVLSNFKYGKLSKQIELMKFDHVPKSWFRHFYVFGGIFSILASLSLFLVYFNFIDKAPELLQILISVGSDPISNYSVSASATFLAMILFTVHCCRRFYETHFVCVYSDSKMNTGIYFVGLLHYFGAILAIICEAPGFIIKSDIAFRIQELTLAHIIASFIFLWANKTQFEATVTLANLRKNGKGETNSTKYDIPRGDYFELVSCPHMMCEIIIYLCMWIILWGNTIWPYVTGWVIVNQVECALLAHWWYRETFKHYPKVRKAVIPYIL